MLLRIYKSYISPIFVVYFGHSCRFTPTCSEYMYEAIKKYGLKGFLMGIYRIIKCNPFTKAGFDPVI